MGKLIEQEGGRAERRRGESPPPFVLFFNNCFDGTYLGAAATFGTFLLVDDIGFTLFNCFCRAFFCTCSASHAFIGDHIGHSHHPLYP